MCIPWRKKSRASSFRIDKGFWEMENFAGTRVLPGLNMCCFKRRSSVVFGFGRWSAQVQLNVITEPSARAWSCLNIIFVRQLR